MKKSRKKLLKETEAALKAKIAAADKVRDAGERLLQYKALQDSCADLYDRSRVVRFGGNDREVLGGIAVALPALAVVGATGVGFIFVAAAGIAAFAVGAKGAHLFLRSGETRHANKMSELEKKINSKIHSLTSLKNMEALARSPRAEEIERAFPGVAAEFNRTAARKKFLAEKSPSASPPTPKF